MANIFFDNPPILSGTQDQKLQQLYNHLFNVSNKLNDAFVMITIEETRAEEQRKAAAAAKEQQGAADSDFIKAKSLIIKTAELVRTEMQEIRTTLTSSVEAVSEQFGTYQETITNEITATALGIMQDYHIFESITGVENGLESLSKKYEGYIFTGILPNAQRAGVAIGEGLYDEDGNFQPDNVVCNITADRISFYQNGTELSYFSNNKFFINEGEIKGMLKIGNFAFRPLSDDSMVLMKV